MSKEAATTSTGHQPTSRRLLWPWLVLILAVIPAVWQVADYEEDRDPEFPTVARPTFSRMPPLAYRLAEPGDTLDRIGVCLTSAAIVLALGGLIRQRGEERGLWPAALALGLGTFWHSANPGPTFDGWHGLGWRALFDRQTPGAVQGALWLGLLTLTAIAAGNLLARPKSLRDLWRHSLQTGTGVLFVAAALLVLVSFFEIPDVEPPGYWPRWTLIWGLIALDLGLLVELAAKLRGKAPLILVPAAVGCWLALVSGGTWLTWYHRPLARLRTVVPGKLYISAMPTRRGLEVAHRRHHFRTIVNLFPEDTPLRSPLLDDELRFAREHGIPYLGSPSDPSPEASNAFLDKTLQLAQDPTAWPMLVHCHGCMDRSPAWMGIYRFVVQGRPLRAILQEIEQHRGHRPKASVTLLYNRVLPLRAPERYRNDPVAKLLRQCAGGTINAVLEPAGKRPAGTNLEAAERVSLPRGTVSPVELRTR